MKNGENNEKDRSLIQSDLECLISGAQANRTSAVIADSKVTNYGGQRTLEKSFSEKVLGNWSVTSTTEDFSVAFNKHCIALKEFHYLSCISALVSPYCQQWSYSLVMIYHTVKCPFYTHAAKDSQKEVWLQLECIEILLPG